MERDLKLEFTPLLLWLNDGEQNNLRLALLQERR
jgi:hypothetical protein